MTPSPHKRLKFPRKTGRRGFVLLASLLVVSLLTILVVASAVLVEIEQQSQYNAARQDVARQNALFGLSQALDQLQVAAGPDRRVTARADILSNATAGTPLEPTKLGYGTDAPATDSGQSFWTGVWMNTSNDFSGCAGNGFVLNPDCSTTYSVPAGSGNISPGSSFLYYDVLPSGATNNANPSSTPLTPLAYPNRAQLYSNNVTGQMGGNVSWLISWPYGYVSGSPDPTQSLSNQITNFNIPVLSGPTKTLPTQFVTLISSINAATNANTNLKATSSSISAPVVPIVAVNPSSSAKVTTGAFAYYISDEGIKAKPNITDPVLAQNPSPTDASANGGYLRYQGHFSAAQSTDASLALNQNTGGGFGATSAVDIRGNSLFAPTLASLTYADNASSSWSDFSANTWKYSSDFTVNSYGILADNFNGGLRKDLTAGLENQTLYINQFGDLVGEPGRKLFSANGIGKSSAADCVGGNTLITSIGSNAGGVTFDGLRWDSLFLYYNLYKSIMPSPISGTPATGPSGVGSQFAAGVGGGTSPVIAQRVYQEQDSASTETFTIDPIFPELVAWTYTPEFGLIRDPGSPTTGVQQYDLVMNNSPQMVLYNPWDVQIHAATGSKVGIGGNISTTATFTSTGDPHPGGYIVQLSCSAGIASDPTNSAATNPDLMPGELRVYGVGADTDLGTQPYSDPITTTNPGPPVTTTTVYTEPFSDSANSTAAVQSLGVSCTKASVNLVSNYSPNNYIKSTILTQMLADPTKDTITITGGTTLETNNLRENVISFFKWPVTGSNNNIYRPQPPALNQKAALQSSNPISHLSPTSLLATSVPLSLFVDRLTGYNSPSANLGTNAGITGTATPGFAAGGTIYNPLDNETNGMMRDFGNTGVLYSGLSWSQAGFNVVPAAPASVTDTYWQPDSVGRGGAKQAIVILKSIPRQPLISLGQFKNMNPFYKENNFDDNDIQDEGFSFYPVGGSYPVDIPTNFAATIAGFGSYMSPQGAIPMLDDDFLSNETLFDGYFLSTVPPAGATDPSNWPIKPTNFNQAYVSANQPLPNARLSYYFRSQPGQTSTAPVITNLQLANVAASNLRKPAANLLINGAFNINSTSVPAWEAFLSSSCGSSSGISTFTMSNTAIPTKLTQYFPAFGSTDSFFPNFPSVTTFGSATPNTLWNGVCKLSQGQIATLAQNIVSQIQLRGPFLSIGDFLNHRLGSAATNLTNSGALQAALDNIGVGGNSGSVPVSYTMSSHAYNGTSVPASYKTTVGLNPTAPANADYGMPGTISQADIVQAIAPAITARSDTFTIRAYGQAINATGNSDAEAYCEAVVQRVPEYLYSTENGNTDSAKGSNNAYDDPNPSATNTESNSSVTPSISGTVSGLTKANAIFGRRFKIISFRWLTKNEL